MAHLRRHQVAERLWQKVTKGEGCWIFHGNRNAGGHGRLMDAEGRIGYAHRISWELTNGRPVPEGLHVRHTCDNPPCVRPDHLVVGTHADNMNDMAERGRSVKGRAPWQKLSDDDVRDIRSRYVRNYERSGHNWRSNAAVLAAEFGVHPQHIHDIYNRRERADVC